ncbi:MAG: Hsp20/alpha crystallin family protein, partial [Gammaproteobacteria bacterium]
EKKKDYHMTERSYGSFERSFRLPGDIDADKINAEFANGILKLTLPKTAEAKAKERKIAIKAK